MKKMMYLVLVTAIMATLALTACSHNKPVPVKQEGYQLPTNSKTTFTVLELPAWIAFSPAGETAIGIAPETGTKKTDYTALAKEFAALALAKNHGSFIVDKPAVAEMADRSEAELKTANFGTLVKGESIALKQTNAGLNLLSQTECQGYKICLFSSEKPSVNNDIIRVSADRTPDWCRTLEPTVDEEFVYAIGSGENANLAEAWKTAQDEALQNLANYKLLNAMPRLRAAKDQDSRMQMLDKITSYSGTSFAKTWFFNKQVNGKSSYNVFIMLKSSK
jgi:hypothetical protein